MLKQAANDETSRRPAPIDAPPTTARSNSKLGLLGSYLRLFREFRRQDLIRFCDEHDELFRLAKITSDHTAVTRHYYGLMASVIATYYGEGWHFCPPEHPRQSRADATKAMYRRIAELLNLQPNMHALDVGSGVGGMMRFLARETGSRMTGITLGVNEAAEANQLAEKMNLDSLCSVVVGDSQSMPFADHSFDSASAVYALKYYPTLDRVMSEIHRVLKPGGRFVAYCLCKSTSFDAGNPQHRKLLNDFEYSTAMPSLHSVHSIIAAARDCGLECVSEQDLSHGKLNWYSWWVANPLLPWLVSSRLVYGLTRSAEAIGVLPEGFTRFNDTFLAGTLRHIIRSGRTGVLTGSALLTFVKK